MNELIEQFLNYISVEKSKGDSLGFAAACLRGEKTECHWNHRINTGCQAESDTGNKKK